MDADARTDYALQYAARIISPTILESTTFLVHCDDGEDVVGGAEPILNSELSSVFIKDNFMLGSAFVQSASANLFASIPTFNSELTMPSTLAKDNGTQHTTVFNRKGMTITNKDIKGDIVAGIVHAVTPSVTLQDGAPLSFSVQCLTDDNLERLGVTIGCSITFKNASNVVLDTKTISTNSNGYSGRLYLEGVVPPTGATTAYLTIYINYSLTYSKVSVTFKNLMLEKGKIAHSWVNTSREANVARYSRVVTSRNKEISAIFWMKVSANGLASHVGNSGPLFITSEDSTVSLGVLHSSEDTANPIFKVMLKNNGVTTYGPSITLPQSSLSTYVPCVLRIAYVEHVDKVRIAFATVDDSLSVLKSEIDVNPFELPHMFNVIFGSESWMEPLNSYITEVRCDEEWLNDLELIVIALSKKPFTLGAYNGIDLEALRNYLDSTGVNLIVNPCGKLGLNHWGPIPSSKFINVTKDATIGSGFLWFGGVCSADTFIGSEAITVVDTETYTYRAIMEALPSTTGNFGIAVKFFNAGSTQVGSTVIEKATQGYTSSYYEIVTQPPAGATTAVAYMYIEGGFNSTRATWTKLKFEHGEGTLYTDDSTISHSVYA
jgi:hypothetical protein